MDASLFHQCIGEFLGTMVLILLGNGVVAGVNLKKTFANGGGWIVITIAWGLAVFMGVLVAGPISGAHLNPAVTIGLAVAGKFAWSWVPFFIISQIIGAMVGQLLVVAMYYPHYVAETEAGLKLATCCTSPAIPNLFSNMASEIIGTVILVLGVLMMHSVVISAGGGDNIVAAYKVDMGALGGIPVALIVVVIGMSLGGTTGYAINPARDFGPRLFHAIFPIPGKGSSNWGYAWIPIAGPIIGACIAAGLYILLHHSGIC